MLTDKTEGELADRIDRHVGVRIRQRRREQAMSQQQLADAIGLTFQQVQKYESGANRVSASKLWQVGQALDTTPGYWFEGLPRDAAAAARYDETAALMLTDDGLELARAYARIPSRSARLALIALARELCGPGRAQATPARAPGPERRRAAAKSA